MGSLWIQTYRLNPSKPSSQESRGFNHGSVKFLSALPAFVLLIVLTGSWQILLTPAVIAFLKDVMRTLWCGLSLGMGVSVFLLVAFAGIITGALFGSSKNAPSASSTDWPTSESFLVRTFR